MIEWKKIELSDRDLFEKHTSNKEGIAMFSFASMFLWRNFYKTSYTLLYDTIVAKGVSDDGDEVIYFPRGIDNIANTEKVIWKMRKLYDKAVSFMPLTNEICDRIAAVFPDAKKNIIDGKCEYVYRRCDLADLSGKKYHAKRNHISKFDKNYTSEYTVINKDNISTLKEAAEYMFNLIDGSPANEYSAIVDAIEHFDELELRGGVLTVGGKVAAYTIGSMINKRVADIHFEKADRGFEGSYAKINQMFVKTSFEDAEYINREEDLGLMGLRKAKLSYHPIHLNQMYSISF